MTNYEHFPDIDAPIEGNFKWGDFHFHIQDMPDYVRDIFKVKRCTPDVAEPDGLNREVAFLQLGQNGWAVVDRLSALPAPQVLSKPALSWQDALVNWKHHV